MTFIADLPDIDWLLDCLSDYPDITTTNEDASDD